MSFMFNPFPYDDPTPINRPALSNATIESIISGEDKIALHLATEMEAYLYKKNGQGMIFCMDGYVAAEWRPLVNLLLRHLELRGLHAEAVDVRGAYKSKDELDAMLADHLPEDREVDPVLLFGKLYGGDFDSLWHPAHFESLLHNVQAKRNEGGIVLVYGAGACHESLRTIADRTLYVDVTPKDAILRIRNGCYMNFGDTSPRPYRGTMRRCYYYDFELACHLRARLLKEDGLDYYIATSGADKSILLDRQALTEICASLVRYPFRCKPVYLEGVWGGQYIKRLRNLPPEMINCAWVFDLIPLEVSLLVQAGETLIEFPFFSFVCKEGEALMGKECVNAFGGYFPIRFNYDDSYHSSGNMSIQVHPPADYCKEHFNEFGRQDESYYVVATGHDAKTYIGLQEDVDSDAFMAEILKSETDHSPVDYARYVHHIDSRPGTQVMIPAGTVHSSGRNQVVLEIGSLTVGSYTFKLYDYLRSDLDGKPRPIHSQHGGRVLARERTGSWARENIVQQPRETRRGPDWAEYTIGEHDLLYFSLHRYEFETNIEADTQGVFHVLTLVDGESVRVSAKKNPDCHYIQNYMDVVVVPANVGPYVIENLGKQPVCIHLTRLKDDFQDSL